MPPLAQLETQQQAIIDIDGHKMSALLFNQRKSTVPVVFIHGITSSVFFWNLGQVPYVKDHVKWISLSLPGHYPAVFPPAMTPQVLTPEHIAYLTAQSIQKLVGDQPVIIGGHSTGGFSAINLTIHYPRMVKALFSISGFAQGTWTGILGLYQQLARMGIVGEWLFKQGVGLSTSHETIYRSVARLYTADAAAAFASPSLIAILEENFPLAQYLSREAMLVWFRQMPQTNISHRLSEITVPTFVLAGDSDPIVPPAQSQLIHAQVPNSELVMLPGAGHLPFSEREAEYNQALTRWLQHTIEA